MAPRLNQMNQSLIILFQIIQIQSFEVTSLATLKIYSLLLFSFHISLILF